MTPWNRSLWWKAVAEARLVLAGCCIAVFSFSWIRVWIVSRLDMSKFQAVLEQLWDTWGKFSPVPLDQVLTYPGRLAWTFTEPIVVLGVAIFAIGRASDVISGELGRGTMEMLLAQPVSRLQVLCSHALVTILGVAAICCMVWLGIAAGIHTNQVTEQVRPSLAIPGTSLRIPNYLVPAEEIDIPLRDRVNPAVYTNATLNLLAMGVFLASLTTLASACDRYRWRTIGIIATVFVLSSVLKVVADAAEGWYWVGWFSYFEAYQPEWSVSVAVNQPDRAWAIWFGGASEQHPGPLGYSLILMTLAACNYILAGVIFVRRDLPAPL